MEAGRQTGQWWLRTMHDVTHWRSMFCMTRVIYSSPHRHITSFMRLLPPNPRKINKHVHLGNSQVPNLSFLLHERIFSSPTRLALNASPASAHPHTPSWRGHETKWKTAIHGIACQAPDNSAHTPPHKRLLITYTTRGWCLSCLCVIRPARHTGTQPPSWNLPYQTNITKKAYICFISAL